MTFQFLTGLEWSHSLFWSASQFLSPHFCLLILVILIIWSGLVWSAGQHLEWDEAVITSVATNQTNKQLRDNRASPDLDLLDFLKSGDRQFQKCSICREKKP